MNKSTIYTFVSFLPLAILLLLNYIEGSLFATGDLTRGFVEDYPALWLTAIGIIVYSTLLFKYLSTIRLLSVEIGKVVHLFSRLGFTIFFFLLNIIQLYLVYLINHSWVTSQLNNNEITWFSYRGSYSYFFDQTLAESFNLSGIFYYFLNIIYFYICLSLIILLAYSVYIIIIYGIKSTKTSLPNKEKLTSIYKQYTTHTTVVVISLLFYYLSLQINDIILEGFETFILHPNRYILMGLMLLVVILYTIVTNYIRYFSAFNANTSIAFHKYLKTELAYELNIILLPFILVTLYSIIISVIFKHDTYNFKLVTSFFLFIIINMFLYLNNFTKKVRFEQLTKLHEENKQLNDYMSTVENLYHETRHYKHDIKNILISLDSFINEEDFSGLKNYYYKEITNKTPISGPIYKLVSQLELIEDINIKAMILNKFALLYDRDFNINIEIYHPVPLLNLDSKSLIRMLGILLDNAIEAAAETDTKLITLTIDKLSQLDNVYSITIANSYINSLDLKKISQLNVSTKGKNRGVGLHSLSRLVSGTSNVTIQTSIDASWFVQELQITNY